MARHIPEEVLDVIRLRANILDVVQSYVPALKKYGSSWKACCPFHHEKTPSFTVNPERGTFKCFGCGKGGNVFSFVMEMEKLDFPNAAELLANKYSVVIPESAPARSGAPRERTENSFQVRDRLYKLHEKLADWYAKNLWDHPDSAVARYFATRGIPKETALRFRIGASPDAWNAAIDFAHREGFTDEELKLGGLVSSKDETPDRIYDRFRNRLMFPICNEQGHVVAFSARSVEADPQGWKYLNSPETPVFKKSRTLYALHFARESILERKYAVLCEGQLDVIAMHRAGCTNAVAPQGTAFGAEQAAILKRYTDEICLAPDNDKAGRAAVFKDAEILLPLGFRLRTAVYPDAKDADELLKKSGPEVLRETVEKAVDFFDFAWETLCADFDVSTPAGKSGASAALRKWLFLIEDPVTLDAYASWLAGKLAVDKQSILQDAERKHRMETEAQARRERFAVKAAPAAPPPPPAEKQELSEQYPGVKKAYLEMLSLLLKAESRAMSAVNDLSSEMLDSTPYGRALELIVQSAMNGEWEEAPDRILMMMAEKEISDPALSAVLMPPETPDGAAEVTFSERAAEKTYRGCLHVISQAYYKRRRKELIGRAMLLPDDAEEKSAILREVTELTGKLLSGRG